MKWIHTQTHTDNRTQSHTTDLGGAWGMTARRYTTCWSADILIAENIRAHCLEIQINLRATGHAALRSTNHHIEWVRPAIDCVTFDYMRCRTGTDGTTPSSHVTAPSTKKFGKHSIRSSISHSQLIVRPKCPSNKRHAVNQMIWKCPNGCTAFHAMFYGRRIRTQSTRMR